MSRHYALDAKILRQRHLVGRTHFSTIDFEVSTEYHSDTRLTIRYLGYGDLRVPLLVGLSTVT